MQKFKNKKIVFTTQICQDIQLMSSKQIKMCAVEMRIFTSDKKGINKLINDTNTNFINKTQSEEQKNG